MPEEDVEIEGVPLTLWGRRTSSNVMKVLWLLDELGLSYNRIDVGGSFGGTATPEYRAMNPLGVVPSLQEGDFTLFESNVILRYLCNQHAPETPLYPREPRGRAVVEAWSELQQTGLNRPQSIVFQGLVRIAPDKRDHGAIAAAIVEAGVIWTILDANLATQDYVAGQQFSLADISFGVHIHRWFGLTFDNRPDTPNLHAWYLRLLKRPAYKMHCAGEIV